jgi:hypothetical protein
MNGRPREGCDDARLVLANEHFDCLMTEPDQPAKPVRELVDPFTQQPELCDS